MARTHCRLIPRKETGDLLRRGFRLVALGVVMLLTLETSSAAGAQQSPPPIPPGPPSHALQRQRTQEAATAPSPTTEDARNESPDSLPSAPTPMLAQQAPEQQQQTTPQQPVGTAAAPYEKPTGVAGSRPAGAAIAPAKQRRVRAIVIRLGIVLAAGAAVGTVVGLSRATHSTP